MQIKTIVLFGLTLLALGANNPNSIASPEPETNPLTTSTPPDELDYRQLAIPSTTLQWSDFALPEAFSLSSGENLFTSNSQLEISSEPIYSPLATKHFQQSTAEHLRQGEVVFNIINRLFFTPGSVEEDGTASYQNFGFTWGITDDLELTLESQRVDTAFPGTQGEFEANRNPEGKNFFLSEQELTLELKQRLWQNSSRTLGLSGIVSLSVGNRGYSFRKDGKIVDEGSRSGLVPALAVPFTAAVGDRARLTFSPTVAFFQQENALHIHRPPTEDPGSFGTTFGFTGAVSYSISRRLILWGDAFIPVTGNNSISRASGNPEKTIAFNAGLRYLVNPRLAVDLFATNTQGSKAPLSLTADREYTALGVGLLFMPDFIRANSSYPDSFAREEVGKVTPLTTDGLGFFDGGTLPREKFIVNLQGGSQGILAALRYGMLKDFELGIYLDYITSDVDESEQGFSGKIRLLNQGEGEFLTASLAATIGLTNETFINFINNDKNESERRGVNGNVPWFFQRDNEDGRRFIFTVSFPLNYDFESGAALWLTPILGYVQRQGTEIAGFNFGGSAPLSEDFSIVGEVGANFTSNGNAFIGNQLENVIPWNVGLRWNLSNVLGLEPTQDNLNPLVDLYVTNRVGFSTWHQLRVREQNDTAVGVSLLIPF